MAFVPKEWKDRLAEFAGRRKLTNVSTGEEMIVDVVRNEGTVSQEGDAFSAANMNDLEQRIKDGFDKVDSDLSNIKSDLQWKYAGESSGVGSSVTIPQNFNELSIVCRYKGFTHQHCCTVPKINGVLSIPITISSTSTYALFFLVGDTSVKIYSESSPGTINTTTYPIIQKVYYR